MSLTHNIDEVRHEAVNAVHQELEEGVNDHLSLVTQTKEDIDSEMLEDKEAFEFSQRIDNQNSSDILNEIINNVRKLVGLPHLVTAEKRRPAFTQELWKKWEEAESVIILAIMHHADILKLITGSKSKKEAKNIISQKNIQEQLSMIARKKNDVLNNMMSELQTEREYQQTVENILEELGDGSINNLNGDSAKLIFGEGGSSSPKRAKKMTEIKEEEEYLRKDSVD